MVRQKLRSAIVLFGIAFLMSGTKACQQDYCVACGANVGTTTPTDTPTQTGTVTLETPTGTLTDTPTVTGTPPTNTPTGTPTASETPTTVPAALPILQAFSMAASPTLSPAPTPDLSSSSTSSDATPTPGVLSDGQHIFHVVAPMTSDTCGGRIATVDQQFVVTTTSSGTTIDTTLVTVPATAKGSSLKARFSENTNGCTRTYSVQFDGVSTGAGVATLSFENGCGSCKTVWKGSLSEDTALRTASDTSTGAGANSVCDPSVPLDIHYRPSLFECSGNAAVLMSDLQRKNFSVVLRRNGSNNDRDPNNPSCTDPQCSPYKTQRKMEIPAYQVNCLGDNGFSQYFTLPNRISVKYVPKVTDLNDPAQFNQYCLFDKQANLH